MLNTLKNICITGSYWNIIKAIYDNPTASITLNQENMKAFPPKSGKKPKMPTATSSFQHSTWNIMPSNQERENIKRDTHMKGRTWIVIICRWHNTIHKKSKQLHQNFLIINNQLHQSNRIQDQHIKVITICVPTMNLMKRKLWKKSYTVASRKIKHLDEVSVKRNVQFSEKVDKNVQQNMERYSLFLTGRTNVVKWLYSQKCYINSIQFGSKYQQHT